jgi:hypothetical protein
MKPLDAFWRRWLSVAQAKAPFRTGVRTARGTRYETLYGIFFEDINYAADGGTSRS